MASTKWACQSVPLLCLRGLNFTQPMLYNEAGVTAGVGYFRIDATEINSLTDWQDQDLKLPKTMEAKNILQLC